MDGLGERRTYDLTHEIVERLEAVTHEPASPMEWDLARAFAGGVTALFDAFSDGPYTG